MAYRFPAGGKQKKLSFGPYPLITLAEALNAVSSLDEVRMRPAPLPVISDRGVEELGWA